MRDESFVDFDLKNGRRLRLEDAGTCLRLVLLELEKELMCRKEKKAVLKQSLGQKAGQLFKGRLQLQWQGDEIHVFAKGEMAGTVHKQRFVNVLNLFPA